MQITFDDPELADLYEGKETVKSFRSNPQLVRQFVKAVNMLRSVETVEQLFQFHGLRYEKLRGGLRNLSSVRINKQYRLLFKEISRPDEPLKITMFAITEVSKHYE